MSMSTLPPADVGTNAASGDVNQLAARVAALEARFPGDSWLFGNSFLKRVFAIWGHYFVAQLIIGFVLGFMFFACTLMFGGLIAGLSSR